LTAKSLEKLGFIQENEHFFDTIKIKVDEVQQSKINSFAVAEKLNLRYEEGYIFVSFDETKSQNDVAQIIDVFRKSTKISSLDIRKDLKEVNIDFPSELERTTGYLDYPVFNSYHTAHEMLRYIKTLEVKDLSLTHSMIPLGSCTMKLNATTEMIPLSWPEFSQIHPCAPQYQAAGDYEMFQ